ncbi:MAG: hypothetical protein HY670_12460 [Chloroflexi bacterium]|nr:hypothetical protein [Chloroflexota bacterium]
MPSRILVITIVSALVQETILVLIVLLGLPRLGIVLPLWGLMALVFAVAGLAAFSYRVGSRALRRIPLRGLAGMVGTVGKTASRMNPNGFVLIKGELWDARTKGERIEAGETVVVVAQDGLKLTIARAIKDNPPPGSPSP